MPDIGGTALLRFVRPTIRFPPPPQRCWLVSCRAAKVPSSCSREQAPEVEKNLKTFDTLDFDVFSNQKWNRLGESHAKDIVVTWPDGHEAKGIEKHIEDLKAMFIYAWCHD